MSRLTGHGFRAARNALSRSLPRTTISARTRTTRRYASTSSEPLSWHSSRHGQSSQRLALAASLAASVAAIYYFSPRARLDADTSDPSPPSIQAVGEGLIPYSEVQKHNTPEDCWVVINGKIYDLTEFAQAGHPGGAAPIHRAAGHDATNIFNPLHPPGTIENGLDPSAYIGNVDPATMPKMLNKAEAGEEDKERKIDLSEIIGLPDFDEAARRNLTSKAWAYMKSGATDEYTLDLNRKAFNAVLFRPRILVDVDVCDTSCEMMGQKNTLPIFISPAGMAGLAHPQAERLLAKGAGECGIIQMISTNASAPLKEIAGSRTREDQPFFMQLYVDRNRPKAEKLIQHINELGMKAIFVTVDAAAPGKREADERSRAEIEMSSGISGSKLKVDSKGGGIGRSAGGFIDPKLNWDDIAWLRKHTKLPIGLKGVQSIEDAKRAADMGVDAIYLSNHGGRALDTAPPAFYTLLEINKYCPEILKKCEVYLDGGARRGTDVIKAMCLGAKGVGMGRPFLYALTYGEEGVTHAIEIMRDEIATTMRLLGVTKIDQLGPHLLNTKALDPLLSDGFAYGPNEKK